MLNIFLESITLDDIISGKIILVDKPIKWTSFDVVKYIRKSLQIRLKCKKIKVGHAGTLDPLATGLLIICIGNETKNIYKYQNLPKKYTGIIKLGETTPSYDRETELDRTYEYNHIDKNAVLNIAESFIGKQKQIPPIFSALKQDGKRLYSYAREKINIEIKPREIEIFNFEILSFSSPYVEFLINCSKGTYIRSIANDYGKKLKSGSHLYKLKRISIGDLSIEDAIRFEQI